MHSPVTVENLSLIDTQEKALVIIVTHAHQYIFNVNSIGLEWYCIRRKCFSYIMANVPTYAARHLPTGYRERFEGRHLLILIFAGS